MNYATIHLLLVQTMYKKLYANDDLSDRLRVRNKTEDVNLKIFNMITDYMNQSYQRKMFHMIAGVDQIVKNATQNKNGTKLKVDVKIKNHWDSIKAKKII